MAPYERLVTHFSVFKALREALKKPAKANIPQMDETIGHLSPFKKKKKKSSIKHQLTPYRT